MKTFIYDRAKASKAVFVFAHGAGADMSSNFIINMTELLLTKGISVVRFNFPYMEKRLLDGKRRPPDRMPKLVEDMTALLDELDLQESLFIGGKSMGSRVAATLLANDPKNPRTIRGLIAIGYPFHPIGKPDNLRLAPIQASSHPMLIIQGERDKLGNRAEIEGYELPQQCQVKFMQDGDHDIKPRVKSGYTLQEHIERAANYIEQFIHECR